jgi:propanol-preferring alcohol dehydrogenase
MSCIIIVAQQQISKKGGPFEIVERPIPEPARNQVLIKVEACGVCHSDVVVKEDLMHIQYPRVPGHEVVGTIVKMGDAVSEKYWKVGQRVGCGWHGGHCFQCQYCRRGDFVMCKEEQITGVNKDGGYAEYMVAPFEALASIPDELSSAEAAPLLCAGITVYNSMRNAGVITGSNVVIVGIGGLGHLAIQYARKMGYNVVAVSTSDDKKDSAFKLGAHHFINSKKENLVEAVNRLGGAKLVVDTSSDVQTLSELASALDVNGKLLALAISGDFKVHPLTLISKRCSIIGWPSGTAVDSEDTLKFSAMTDVKPIIETYPLEKANEAYERMISNKARFRVVLTMNK